MATKGSHLTPEQKDEANPSANLLLYSALLRHQVYLLQYSGWVRNQVLATLDNVEERISEIVAGRASRIRGLTSKEDVAKLKRLANDVNAVRAGAWDKAREFLTEDMRKLVSQEVQFAKTAVETSAPVILELATPLKSELNNLAKNLPIEGHTVDQWVDAMQADDARRINAALQAGVVAQESPSQIVQRILGTAEAQGTNGATQLTRAQVQTITRTASLGLANAARETFFNENSDVFEEEQFVATLDSRTTPICRSLDGNRYPIGEGPHPPLHYACRSIRIPVIGEGTISNRPAKPVTEQMVVREFAAENNLGDIQWREDLPRGYKKQYDEYARKRIRQLTGTVPSSTTYQSWLKTQSKQFQDDVLGKTRAKLFREGGLTLDKFVDHSGAQITLKELAARDAAAFRAAGLDPKDYA